MMLSGLLFALIYNTFLNNIRLVIDERGRDKRRACADDLGACLFDIRLLAHFWGALQWAARLVNLVLHEGKFIVVPCFWWPA